MVPQKDIEAVEEIYGAFLFIHNQFPDNRGVFSVVESGYRFSQCNLSKSKKGVFRGLHYQTSNPQGKLITCLSGEIWDIALDLRSHSPTYGHTHMVHLSANCGYSFYVPSGCAHGFYSLSESEIMYLCTTPYDKLTDTGVNVFSPTLKISSIFGDTVLSEKDLALPKFIRGKTFCP